MNDFYLVIGSSTVLIIALSILVYGLWKKDNEHKKRHDDYVEAMNAETMRQSDTDRIRRK